MFLEWVYGYNTFMDMIQFLLGETYKKGLKQKLKRTFAFKTR